MGKNKAVIFAGGVGERMKLGKPKQFIELMHRPIIAETISYFQKNDDVDEIYVVITKGYEDVMERIKETFNFTKIVSIINGDTTGMRSIYKGLCEAAKNLEDDDIVLIHDGVRPLITTELISSNIKVAREKGNCISVGKIVETPIMIENNNIKRVLDRNETLIAKAPQTFFLKEIKEMHEKAREDEKLYDSFVDNCSLAFYYGKKLNYTLSSSANIKITTKPDVYKMIGLLNGKDYENLFVMKKNDEE